MQYLTFEEYSNMGGVVDLTAFNRLIVSASAYIDSRTKNRLKSFEVLPDIVSVVCFNLVEFMAQNGAESNISSISQSVNGASESISYVKYGSAEYADMLDGIIQPLESVATDKGYSVLYRGVGE